MATAPSPRLSWSRPQKSLPSKPSTPPIAVPPGPILMRTKASHGPPGSSPGSADGMAVRKHDPRAQSPSSTGWTRCRPWREDGRSETCTLPSANAGTTPLVAALTQPTNLLGAREVFLQPVDMVVAVDDLLLAHQGLEQRHRGLDAVDDEF